MIGLALGVCLGASGGGGLQAGDTLPGGLHPAGIVLLACQAVDGFPMVLADPDIGSIGVHLLIPLRIHRSTLDSIDVALRMVGIFRVPYRDSDGNAYLWVTRDARSRPQESVPYKVQILRLRHIEAKIAATVLNRLARAREQGEDGTRTRFVAYEKGNRLVARYTSQELLDGYLLELRKLDTPPEKKRTTVMRSYPCQKRFAVEVVEAFWPRWNKVSNVEITVVISKPSNSILLRLPEPLWETAKKILEEVDQHAPPGRP